MKNLIFRRSFSFSKVAPVIKPVEVILDEITVTKGILTVLSEIGSNFGYVSAIGIERLAIQIVRSCKAVSYEISIFDANTSPTRYVDFVKEQLTKLSDYDFVAIKTRLLSSFQEFKLILETCRIRIQDIIDNVKEEIRFEA